MTTIPSGDRYDISVRSAGLRRRKVTEKAFAGLAVASAVIAVAILALVLGTVIHRGLSALSLDFFTKPRPLFGQAGGIADALVGSALIVGMAMVMAIPMSILVAIFMSEYAGPRVSVALRIVLDVLNGVPAIVVGIFVFGLLVVGRGQSAIFGAFSLAVLMLPMVARATQEVLEIVPRSLREASLALGVTRWRTTLSVVLPTAIGGILTGVVIAVARVAGETAPLIFTSLGNTNWSTDITKPMASLPIAILRYAGSPYEDWKALAWTGALLITVGVLALNIASRLSLAALKRGQA